MGTLREAIANELALPAYAGLTPEQQFAALTDARQVTQTVPVTLTTQGIMQQLSAETLAKLVDCPQLSHVIDAINVGNRAALALWLAALAGAGKVTPVETAAIQAAMTETHQVTTTLPPRYCEIIGGIEGAPNTLTLEQFNELIA